MKTCYRCGDTKPLDGFYLRPNGKPYTPCKQCKVEVAAAYKVANPERNDAYKRRTHLREKYGISEAQYEAMHASQDGLCAICGKPEAAQRMGRLMRLAVDHDHTTGAIRGLLCIICNRDIGVIERRLDELLAYLAQHQMAGVA